MVFDTAIIGTGPAGLSAAINLKLHNKEILWLGDRNFSSKVARSEKIANYPGMGMITGGELIARFAAHAEDMGLNITEQMVTAIMPMDGSFMLSAGSDVYTARTLLFAVGASSGKGIEGEEEFLGRGVSYCATCDGFLYKGKTISVICGDPRFEHEVDYLSELADRVYVYSAYKGGKYGIGSTVPEGSNIVLLGKPVKRVFGGMKVSGIELTDGAAIETEGLFCLRNSIAPTALLPALKLDGPHIAVDRQMRTSEAGCFAAGDCTGRPYQIAKSVGEGNIAAHSIIAYLAG